MVRDGWRWYLIAATAVAALAGIFIQVLVAAGNDEGAVFPTTAGRVFNVFCFFTILSNLLVAITSVLLLMPRNVAEDDRRGTSPVVWQAKPNIGFWAFRLAGLVAITVTFVVFHTVLSRLYEFEGWAAVANQLIHTVAPLLAIAAWVLAGPRGHATPRIALLSLLPAGAWLVFMLIRGELIDYYPYPFVDVADHGYPRTLLNAALIGVLFYGLARGAVWLDQRLSPSAAVASRPDSH
jgi:hypothetical protein